MGPKVIKAPDQLTIRISESDAVTALLYETPTKTRSAITLILGHGAGANQMSGFMRLFAGGLADRGLDVMTFNFLYSEKGRGGPDPKAKLEACYRAVIEAAATHRKLQGNKLAIGGKSMGGRIGSQVAAASLECGHKAPLSKALTRQRTPNIEVNAGALTSAAEIEIAALVFLGYPLHPPGNLEKMRDAHLKDIKAPMLFLQGSRDTFGTAAEIRAVIKKHNLPATLCEIEGGDHSFKVPKSIGLTQEQVYESAMDEIVDWLRTTLG